MLVRILLIGLVAVAAGYRQTSFTSKSGGARIILSNYNDAHGDFPTGATSEKHVDFTGTPVQLFSPEKGFTARGHKLEFTWAELDPKTVEFRKGRLEGTATMIFDSAVAQQALTEDALAQKVAPPTPRTEDNRIEVNSETFLYSGTVERGIMTMPKPWTLQDAAKGSQIHKKKGLPLKVNYEQTLDADSSSGTLSVVRGPDGNLGKLETGTFEGPVHFKLVRHETPDGTSVTTTSTYSGVADRMQIDLTTTPGTMTATGHVSIDADSTEMSGRMTVDKFVFRVTDKLELLGFDSSGAQSAIGKPGTLMIKTKGGTR